MGHTFGVSAQDGLKSHYTVCAIECGECTEGNFLRVTDTLARCGTCGHEVAPRDIVDQLEEGESARFIGQVLSVVVAWSVTVVHPFVTCEHCGDDAMIHEWMTREGCDRI